MDPERQVSGEHNKSQEGYNEEHYREEDERTHRPYQKSGNFSEKRLDYHDYKRKDTYRDEGYRGNYQKAPYGNRDFNQGRGNYYPNRNNQKY